MAVSKMKNSSNRRRRNYQALHKTSKKSTTKYPKYLDIPLATELELVETNNTNTKETV